MKPKTRQDWMAENYEKVFKYARRQGYSEDEAYDVAGWFLERNPDATHIDPRFPFIDYYRHHYGRKGSSTQHARRLLQDGVPLPLSQDDSDDRIPDVRDERDDYGRFEKFEELRAVIGQLKGVPEKHKLMIFMKSEGYSNRQIGNYFGVSESRISQIITFIQTKMALRKKRGEILELKDQVTYLYQITDWFSL